MGFGELDIVVCVSEGRGEVFSHGRLGPMNVTRERDKKDTRRPSKWRRLRGTQHGKCCSNLYHRKPTNEEETKNDDGDEQ